MRPMPKMPMAGPRGPVTPGKPMTGLGSGPMPMPRPTSMPMTNVMPVKPMGMKKGGTASSRADGCAQRGKTRGKFV
jgi:hypothetical protein